MSFWDALTEAEKKAIDKRYDAKLRKLSAQFFALFFSLPASHQKQILATTPPYVFASPVREAWEYFRGRPLKPEEERYTTRMLMELDPELASNLQDLVAYNSVEDPDPAEARAVLASIRRFFSLAQVNALGFYLAKLNGTTDLYDVLPRVQSYIQRVKYDYGFAEPVNAGEIGISVLETPPVTIPTGFSFLDEYSGGIPRGALTVLAGPQGSGKTSFLLQLCLTLAFSGTPTVFFALEKGQEYIARLVGAQLTGVSYRRIANSELTPEEKERVKKAYAVVKRIPFYVFDPAKLDAKAFGIRRLSAYVRDYATGEQKVVLFAIDHLQLLGSDARELGSVVEILTRLVNEENVAIILASQVSGEGKKMYTYGSRKPLQLADLAAFLEIPKDDKSREVRDYRLFHIVKNRYGRVGFVRLDFDGESQTFRDARDQVDPLDKWRREVDWEEVSEDELPF